MVSSHRSLKGSYPASAPAFTRSGKSPGSPRVGNMQPACPEYKTSGLYTPGARRLGTQPSQETIELCLGRNSGEMWLGAVKVKWSRNSVKVLFKPITLDVMGGCLRSLRAPHDYGRRNVVI